MNIYKAHNKRKTLVAYSGLPPVYRIKERKTSFYNPRYITTSTCKGPFIATQLNSTQLDVELSWVELSCVAMNTLYDAASASVTVGRRSSVVLEISEPPAIVGEAKV